MNSNVWIEVDLNAIRHNYQQIAAVMGSSEVIAVVKSNAYGHGFSETARALRQAGARTLAVTHTHELRSLRESGLDGDVLLLVPPRGEDVASAVEMNGICCVMDPEGVLALQEASRQQGKDTRVHLKVDTGMGRLGIKPEGVLELARMITACPELKLEGIFSHCADGPNEPAVVRQLKQFQGCVDELRRSGIETPICHLAASAAALTVPDARLDAVRIGTLLYGQYSTGILERKWQGNGLDLHNTWSFRSRIIAIRGFMPGTSVGYGSEFQTGRVSKIAVVPVGLADGLGMMPSSLQKHGLAGAVKALVRPRFTLWATVKEERVPVVGRIAMQMCSIDVTDVPNVEVGDVVELPVRRIAASSSIPRVFIG